MAAHNKLSAPEETKVFLVELPYRTGVNTAISNAEGDNRRYEEGGEEMWKTLKPQ